MQDKAQSSPVMLKTLLPDHFGRGNDDPANRQYIRLDTIRLVQPYYDHNSMVFVDGIPNGFVVEMLAEAIIAKIEEHAHAG